jgi:NADH-quinone oxidoreductase subunit H
MDFALILEYAIKSIVLILALLVGFGYLTYYERRFLARMQLRIGPNRAGPYGLLQWVADAIKLIFKEELVPAKADKVIFFLAPILTMVPVTVLAGIIPWGTSVRLFGREVTLYIADINVGILYFMAVASIAVYGLVLAGWSSNNKYATMGGLRSTAQMIAYELTLGLCFVTAVLLGDSMRTLDIVAAQRDMWFVVLQPVGAVIFIIATLAEVNRAPFDMPEAEQELTAGYHTEYSGMKFALFFMAEYEKMIVISMIGATLFFGGFREFWFLKDTFLSVDQTPWLGPLYLFLKLLVFLGGMIWVRATLPRLRYDRLMSLGWKVLLPLSLVIVFITAVGIILAESNPLFIWLIPILSIIAGLVAVIAVHMELRRKEYARS